MFTGGGPSAGGSDADCKLGLTVVRPNLLSTPETLGNGTESSIYHVGTRRLHLFLLYVHCMLNCLSLFFQFSPSHFHLFKFNLFTKGPVAISARVLTSYMRYDISSKTVVNRISYVHNSTVVVKDAAWSSFIKTIIC